MSSVFASTNADWTLIEAQELEPRSTLEQADTARAVTRFKLKTGKVAEIVMPDGTQVTIDCTDLPTGTVAKFRELQFRDDDCVLKTAHFLMTSPTTVT